MIAGVPAGWEGREREDLREGAWRFVRVRDPVGRSSVREDNLPLRDGEPMPGPAGLADFLADRDRAGTPTRRAWPGRSATS